MEKKIIKTKYLHVYDGDDGEEKQTIHELINEFLKKNKQCKIIDIKFQETADKEWYIRTAALIIYETKKK